MVWTSLVIGIGITGLVAVTGEPFFGAVYLAILAGIPLLFRPRVLFWVIAGAALLVVGLIRLYLPQYQAIRWLVTLAALALPILLLPGFLSAKGRLGMGSVPSTLLACLAFILFTIATTLWNGQGIASLIFGLKSYFQAWGLILALALMSREPGFSKQLLRFLLVIGVLQIPFALHQYFVLAPLRVGLGPLISPADIVAGTFGAEMTGGGNNAALASFQFMCIAIVLMCWREKLVSGTAAITAILFLALPLLLNETKVSVFYAMVMFAILFREDIAAKPLRFVGAFLFLLVALAVFVSLYAYMAESANGVHSLSEYADLLVQNNLYRGYGAYELNRWSALTFWFDQHFPGDFLRGMIGHGLGQTAEGSAVLDVGRTLANTRYYGMGIGLTSLSALLWEVGGLGVALVIGIFLSAISAASRLSKIFPKGSAEVVLLGAFQAALAIQLLGLAHKAFFTMELTYQTVFALLVGCVVHLHGKGKACTHPTLPSLAKRLR